MKYNDILNSRFSEPAGILVYREGNIRLLDINDRFLPELRMNISKEEYLGADPSKSLDEDNMRVFLRAVSKCAETGKEQTVDTWREMFSNCCGTDRICLTSRLVPVEDTSEGFVIYEGIRNITDEKLTRSELDDIEYRYKAASEQINIYNWEYTVATKEMRPCYRCMRDLGLPALVTNYPEPAIEAGIFPPDYADMYRDMMHKIDEGAPELEADIPLTIGRIPFRVKYTTEFDDAGNPVKAFGSATLISETELGHIRLDNQIISSLADGYDCIYLADFVSDKVQIIKQQDILDIKEGTDCKGLLDIFAELLKDTVVDRNIILDDITLLREDLFKDSDRREFVYKDLGKNGDRWISVGYQVIERSPNKVDRLLITASVVDDLRAQKMDADRMIARQKDELEDRQKLLMEAIDEANRANLAKTEFFSNMSHDIRTPMSAITGFSRLALDDIDNRDNLEDYLGRIISAGDHLMNLINDILDMSRIESGKMEIVTSPNRLKDLILECADMVRIKMQENGLNFIVDVDDLGDDVVECDKLKVNQVILNLLSNAYKFTNEGGNVSLTARLINRDELNTYEIRVKDTGIGMSPEFRDHIWEAYSREKNETVHEIQGTGLGMVIVRSIVNLMHGTITLESEKGKGSEFIIVLPLRPTSEKPGESEKDILIADALDRDYEGVTVLVVDDTPTNLKLADRILNSFGFTVITARSGVDAIEILNSSPDGGIDLILMDVMMPVMDGLEATRRIRSMKDSVYSGIPIIAMTANAFASDVQEALEAGMNAHIPKPFKKEDLILAINDNLSIS